MDNERERVSLNDYKTWKDSMPDTDTDTLKDRSKSR